MENSVKIRLGIRKAGAQIRKSPAYLVSSGYFSLQVSCHVKTFWLSLSEAAITHKITAPPSKNFFLGTTNGVRFVPG